MRRTGRKDANHQIIVEAIEIAGGCVIDLSAHGSGVPDLIVWTRKGIQLAEVKNPNNSYGRRGLAPRQKSWAEDWKGGPVFLLHTVEDAVALVCGEFSKLKACGGWQQ